MAKVTDLLTPGRAAPVFLCDFSPPRGADPALLEDASQLDADFICVAYNPGRAVRADSVAVAAHLKRAYGREVVFNLSPRDMNKLALQSQLLGAQLLGLENVVIIQGDPLSERDQFTHVRDYTATGLIAAARELNEGSDFRGAKLRAPTDLCIGAGLDLGRGSNEEARLVWRKVEAGAQFFIAQPVLDGGAVTDFQADYETLTGRPLAQPVFWGLQILAKDGVLFSTVPEDLRRDLENGRDGVDIALETYALLSEVGVDTVYLVPPILRGGARDYAAAARFLAEVRGQGQAASG